MLGERIRNLFKKQGITIVSILTAVGMAIGVLIEALLGGPTVSTITTTSGNTSAGDGKGGGAREWIKKQTESFIAIIRQISRQSLGSTARNHIEPMVQYFHGF